jgi:hypothetical protein
MKYYIEERDVNSACLGDLEGRQLKDEGLFQFFK